MYWKQNGEMPTMSLHVVSFAGTDAVDVPIEMDLEEYERWLDARTQELIREAQEQEADYKRKKKLSAKLVLPFEQARPGQKELIEQIENGVGQG
jgi:hypothetical protein